MEEKKMDEELGNYNMQDLLSLCEEESIQLAYRMDYAEQMKEDIKRYAALNDFPRILKDITSLFRPEMYLNIDHLVLFFRTVHDVFGYLRPHEKEYLKEKLEGMENVFNGTLDSDPLIDKERLYLNYKYAT